MLDIKMCTRELQSPNAHGISPVNFTCAYYASHNSNPLIGFYCLMSEPSQPGNQSLHIDGVYKSAKPAEELIADLKALGVMDKEAEAQVKKWKTLCYVSIAVACCSMCLCMAQGVFMYIAFVILAGGIGFAIWAHSKKKQFEKDDFPDHRYLTCDRLVSLLSADIESGSTIDTTINLRDATTNPAGVETGKTGQSTWNSINTADQFLQLSGRFIDGTKFDFGLTEKVDAYGEHFPYRARSGKTKTKLKARKRIQWLATLRLRYKDKRYPDVPKAVAKIEEMIQLPEGAKLKKIDAKDGEISLVAITSPTKLRHKVKMSQDIQGAWNDMPMDPNAMDSITGFSAKLFLSLYHVLNSSKGTQS